MLCKAIREQPLLKKLRVVLQEREVASLNYFEVFLTIANNFVDLSCLSCSFSVYLSLFWNIFVYFSVSWCILVHQRLSRSISGYLELSRAILDYLGLSLTISDYL